MPRWPLAGGGGGGSLTVMRKVSLAGGLVGPMAVTLYVTEDAGVTCRVPVPTGVTEPIPGWISTVVALVDVHVIVTVPPRVMVCVSARRVTVGAGIAGCGGAGGVEAAGGGGGGGAGVFFLHANDTNVKSSSNSAVDRQDCDRLIQGPPKLFDRDIAGPGRRLIDSVARQLADFSSIRQHRIDLQGSGSIRFENQVSSVR